MSTCRRKPRHRRNPVAAQLGDAKYRKRVVSDGKTYSRKAKHKSRDRNQRPALSLCACLLEAEDRATFKKFRPRGGGSQGVDIIDLVPLSEYWPTLRIDADHRGRVVATLIEHHRRFRRQG